MEPLPRTRLAVLGTMAELHHQPLVYDLACLRALVADLEPDLLCTEVTPAVWEVGDLSAATVEVREALATVVASTDVVLVPVSPTPERYADFAPASGWRRGVVGAFDRLLRWVQRTLSRPEAINARSFRLFCHSICWLNEQMWTGEDRQSWEAQNRLIVENILQTVRRDPGHRVLVAVQCQRVHRLVPVLRAHAVELELVPYQEL